MDIEKPPPLTDTATRFMRAVSLFASSEAGSRAKWMLAWLLALLCGANGLNVINSYIGRNFHVGDRRAADRRIRPPGDVLCRRIASTVIAVVARLLEERLDSCGETAWPSEL